jgi:outer membrane protein OmpA-like peptidoglycan-associated protein
MRMFGIFFIWVMTFAVTGAAFWGYTKFVVRKRSSISAEISKYEKKWAAAVKDPATLPPPDAEDVIKEAPIGQQREVRKKVEEIKDKEQKKYNEALENAFDELGQKFEREWNLALKTFADTPTVEEFTKREVHDFHRKALEGRLTPVAALKQKRSPRTPLRIDNFSGYFVLRSDKFRDRLAELLRAKSPPLEINLHLQDDKAVYPERLKAIAEGKAPLAVFTLDALINNSEAHIKTDNKAPAAVVLLIDESRGADAVIAYPDMYASPEDLAKDKDLRIVLTGDSPSEMLARLICDKYGLSPECFIKVDPNKGVDDVYEKFLKASPTEHRIYILWEPYISRALKERPKAHKLITSEKFPSSIVDVLVVQKAYLETHRAEVQTIAQAYSDASKEYQKDQNTTVTAVQEDAKKQVAAKTMSEPLNRDDALEIVRGIAWKSLADNFESFGLGANPVSPPPLEGMIKDIAKVLSKTVAINYNVKPEMFYDAVALKDVTGGTAPIGSSDPWSKLRPVVGHLATVLVRFSSSGGGAKISDTAEDQLKEVAELLKKSSKYYLEIRGVPSDVGDAEANKALAQKRAEAVKDWLVKEGPIDANRLKAIVVEKPTEEDKKKGAGVSFILLED